MPTLPGEGHVRVCMGTLIIKTVQKRVTSLNVPLRNRNGYLPIPARMNPMVPYLTSSGCEQLMKSTRWLALLEHQELKEEALL